MNDVLQWMLDRVGETKFPASVFLNMLTETEMCALFRSSTQIIADTALLMSHRDAEVNVGKHTLQRRDDGLCF